jgi:hypothetical protein
MAQTAVPAKHVSFLSVGVALICENLYLHREDSIRATDRHDGNQHCPIEPKAFHGWLRNELISTQTDNT